MKDRSALRPFAARCDDFRAGVDSPRAFLERCFETYAAREGDVRAFVWVDFDSARKAADAASRRWMAGRPLSPIDGMPVGIKDVIETEDMPTQMGSPLYAGWRSQRDSACVRALREAGAAIVGKTVTTEFATTLPDKTRNPHDLARTPGGSSSGSAASVGCGMLPAALGTQVVGSIIRPASYCGCWGYKPTFGGANRGGSHDFMSQSCLGALAASRDDAWRTVIEIVLRAGGDPGAPGVVGPAEPPAPKRPPRIAMLETPGWAAAPDNVKSLLLGALDNLRGEGFDIAPARSDPSLGAIEDRLAEAHDLTRVINAWESRWPLNVYAARDANKLSDGLKARLREAESMSVEDYRAALARRAAIRAEFESLARRFAAFIGLSAPDVAPVGLHSTGDAACAVPASFLGVPAISMPLLAVGLLPLGVQLIGFAQRDAELFAFAGALAA